MALCLKSRLTASSLRLHFFVSIKVCRWHESAGTTSPRHQRKSIHGTTLPGGPNSSACPHGCGTIFEITPTGTLTTLHEFCTTESCSDDSQPRGLTLAANGDFYGASINNKETYGGTFFRISADGNYKNLYQFCEHTNCLDSAFPSSVVQGTDGNFYGTTLMGGSGNGGSGAGTFFRITPRGELTTLYNFCSQTNCTGWDPSPVILGTDGNFYGTTDQGEPTRILLVHPAMAAARSSKSLPPAN